jgi:hypothetical protein
LYIAENNVLLCGIDQMCNLIYGVRQVRFGTVEWRQQHPEHIPNGRQKKISRLRKELRSLKHWWSKAGPEENPDWQNFVSKLEPISCQFDAQKHKERRG